MLKETTGAIDVYNFNQLLSRSILFSYVVYNSKTGRKHTFGGVYI